MEGVRAAILLGNSNSLKASDSSKYSEIEVFKENQQLFDSLLEYFAKNSASEMFEKKQIFKVSLSHLSIENSAPSVDDDNAVSLTWSSHVVILMKTKIQFVRSDFLIIPR